jgi:membrane protein YdbS with pleckstrin-like domain
MEPAVPIDALPEYWGLSAEHHLELINAQYLHREHALTGWWWLSALGQGDYLNFLGIALLATVTIVCFVGIIPMLLRKRDWIYAAIAVTETVILALAASGLLSTGGH